MNGTISRRIVYLLLPAAIAAHAADITWEHNGTDFNTAANWDGDVPGAGDRAIFGLPPATDPVMNPNLSASVTLERLHFTGSGYTLDGEAINPTSVANASPGSPDTTGIYSATGTNTINAPITYSGTGVRQIIAGAGSTLILSGAITHAGTLRIYNSSTGTTRLLNANTGLTGTVNIDGGIHEIGHDQAFGDASMNTFRATSTLVAFGGDRVIGNPIVVDQGRMITVSGSNNLEWSGNVTIRGASGTSGWNNNGTGLLTLSGNVFLSSGNFQKALHLGGSGAIVISGNIADRDGPPTTRNDVSLTGTAGSSVLLSGTNTYTGNTTVGANSSLTLDEAGSLTFHIEDAENNWVTGAGTVQFDGTLIVDVDDVTVEEGEWTLVNTGDLSETFGATFGVVRSSGQSFSDIGDGVYQLDAAENLRWEFDRNTGMLSLSLRPPPGTLLIFR